MKEWQGRIAGEQVSTIKIEHVRKIVHSEFRSVAISCLIRFASRMFGNDRVAGLGFSAGFRTKRLSDDCFE
jgi:hypothetical protein